MSQAQFREIKTYVANELFRARKRTNALIKEFERVKTMREDVRSVQHQANASTTQLDGDASLQHRLQKRTTLMEKQLDG